MDDFKQFRIAVRGLIYNQNNEVLLLRRSRPARGETGYWELPGGGLDHGESPQQALLREIQEETRLEVEVGMPLLVWDYVRSDQLQIIGMTFFCRWTSGNIGLSHEHDTYTWVTLEQISKYKVFPELQSEISKLIAQEVNHDLGHH